MAKHGSAPPRGLPSDLPFYLVAVAAVVVIVLRMAVPGLAFDQTSLTLFGIAATSLVLPRLVAIFPPLKRLKFMQLEAEFNEALDRLEQKVVATEASAGSKPPNKERTGETGAEEEKTAAGVYPLIYREYVDAYQKILASEASNLEKVVSAAILVERMLTEAGCSVSLPVERRSTAAIVRDLASGGFISQAEASAFEEFWRVRNLAVHGRVELSAEQTARLLDLAYRLVRTFA